MLRAGFGILSPTIFAPASLQAVQQVIAVAQQQSFATKQATPRAKKAAAAKSTAGAKANKAEKKKGADARPPSAYNLFVKERAAAVLASSPPPAGTAGTAAHAMKILGQNWKAMSDAEKAPYVDRAAALKSDTMQARDAAKKDKGPPNSYALFVKEQYAKLGGSMKVPEATRHISALWKAMPEAEKQQRKEAADAARAAWKASQGK